MAQKILAGRCADPTLSGEFVEVKVDHVVLARAPNLAFGEALSAGLKKTSVEVAIAYDGACVVQSRPIAAASSNHARAISSEMPAHGILVARPGIGFPSMVHLERFASPARFCVTDEPRLAGVGGVGMLSFVVSPGLLGQALATGSVWVRPPRSIHVALSGRVRPFVCARDIALELLRRGLGDAVRKVEALHNAPVVIEFAGPSARLLSVSERAVLCAVAPHLGAAAAVFVSDERTEVFLRDQRRSKAHRGLVPDAGAPCDDVLNVDLGAVDPLLLDEQGEVRSVRDLAGKPVSQVILGGDSGITLRDMFAAAALLKSKRVPARLDLLLSIPSRQMLEVLASSGALTDLIATGARLVEPDARVVSGELYPPTHPSQGLSARSFDPEPREPNALSSIVASAETLAYAVATGEIGDPRAFKRPVRVIVPRTLPTDDVLVIRDRGRQTSAKSAKPEAPPAAASPTPWKAAQTLDVIDAAQFDASQITNGAPPSKNGAAILCTTLDDVRRVSTAAIENASYVRAVFAPFIPSGIVAALSGVGIAAIQIEPANVKAMKGERTIALPAPAQWAERGTTSIAIGGSKVPLVWLARGVERTWTGAGAVRSNRESVKMPAAPRANR